jgi:hypothetical protein
LPVVPRPPTNHRLFADSNDYNARMIAIPHSDAWLHHIAPRLSAGGFGPLHPQTYQPAGFKFAVRRTQFEFTKFGMAETFFFFADLPNLEPQMMAAFSAAAYRFAIASKAVPLPCGLFEAVFVFPVAITANLHPQMADWIRRTTPPAHWASNEMPVAFDTANGTLCYFEGTPLWGAAYFGGFRSLIRQYLG